MGSGDKGRVLVVLSGADHLRMKNGTMLKTGFFLNELSDPLAYLHRAGFSVDFASPGRRTPAIDPLSLNFLKGERRTQALARVETREGLMRPLAIERITDSELNDYSGVFVPGGHAPMADLAGMERMKILFEHFHRGYKPTCLIGHGVAALIPSITQDRPWIYRGYQMTCNSDWMDWVARIILRRLPGKPPFSITQNLKRAGGIVRHNHLPGRPFVIENHELLTGQDPKSADMLGRAFVTKLEEYRKKDPLI
jgi:putative intracellular protease/amidase